MVNLAPEWWVAVTCGVLAACALLPLAAGEGDEADSVVTVMAVTLDGEGLIKSCWQQEHKARPSAAEVAAFLADSPRLLAPCLDVPLDALPLDLDCGLDPWRESRDRAEARWVSWAAPASAATDTTYLSADAPPPQDTDAFLP
ncbi:hypothetical protein B5X24_HaOG214305 [Helicoverpa armigera]|nr:hypothetical protein B5X24_HaOG214305 [Helicoverpa armigera]